MSQVKNGKSKSRGSAKNSAKEKPSSIKNRGVRLKRLRNLTGLSRQDIEDKYKIPANTLRSWEDGLNTGLTEQGAKRMLIALRGENIRCSIGWLLNGTGNSPEGIASNLFQDNQIHYDNRSSTTLSPIKEENKNIQIEISTFCNLHTNATFLEITDDGMEPFYQNHDYVAGIMYHDDNILEAVGKNCIIETKSGETYVRQLRLGKKSGHFNLICLNTQTTSEEPAIYDVKLAYAAPVLWHRIKKAK